MSFLVWLYWNYKFKKTPHKSSGLSYQRKARQLLQVILFKEDFIIVLYDLLYKCVTV